MADSVKQSDIITFFVLLFIMVFGSFCYFAFQPVEAFELQWDTELPKNCLPYAYKLSDTIPNSEVMVFFSSNHTIGHAMVLVNHKQPDCYLIESYTGQEFRTYEQLQTHFAQINWSSWKAKTYSKHIQHTLGTGTPNIMRRK